MAEKRATLETIAPSVEEAIQNGLLELGLQREQVNVDILDEGSRGLFGIGSRQARVRLTVKNHVNREPAVAIKLPPDSIPLTLPAMPEPVQPAPEQESNAAILAAKETVSELLQYMKVPAEVSVRYGDPDETQARTPLLVEISGDDLSILIGKRAETLNALQLIASLIISKRLGQAVSLTVDVEGYRQRRFNQVRQLALRMADQAIKTGKRQMLEPMSASERRIVHITLRENPQVKTESTGEEPHRKVMIFPIK